MKKVFLCIAVVLCSIVATAQNNQYYWLNGNLLMGNVVSQIDSITFGSDETTDTLLVLLPRTVTKVIHDTVYITVHDTVCPGEAIEGSLAGEFSVSVTKKVRFSKGNLQYNAALGTHQCADGTIKQGTWRFAENQYDTIGRPNVEASSTYDGWIDLFGWGTSGWNSGANTYNPWSRVYGYDNFRVGGDWQNDLTEEFAYADWGFYNAISNGGNSPSLWHTLSRDEVEYMFYTRPNANQLYGYATVNGITGLMILPDNWHMPNDLTFTPTTTNFTINTFSLSEWNSISSQVVFLPCASIIVGYNIFGEDMPGEELQHEGIYWLSTAGNESWGSYHITVRPDRFNPIELNYWRCDGLSVRLVQDIE